MDIPVTIKLMLNDLVAWLTTHFNGPEGALQALAIAGLVVIILLFLVARGQEKAHMRSLANEPVILTNRVDGPPATGNDMSANARLAGASDPLEQSAKPGSPSKTAGEDEAADKGGFVFHRRKAKSKPRHTPSAASAEPVGTLAAIEQEMLATRQLYLDGVISKDVYVAETRTLYTKAQEQF